MKYYRRQIFMSRRALNHVPLLLLPLHHRWKRRYLLARLGRRARLARNFRDVSLGAG